jgi:hypothetical protein
VSERPLEREADHFAAALLLPRRPFLERLRQRNFRCTLSDLLHLADAVFHTSVVSTAVRYAQMDVEPCCLVLSREGRVLWGWRSEEMRRLGLGWVERGRPLPARSVTARLTGTLQDRGDVKGEGATDSEVWFDGGRPVGLWEEALVLGRTGLTLSFLVAEEVDEEDD